MKSLFRLLTVFLGVLVIAIVALRLAFPLPDVSDRAESTALPADENTFLGGLMAEGMQANGPEATGIHPLPRGDDALISRLALIDAAQVSVDAQYYIWHDDISGILLLDALDRAARRGVRVRLLVDDNGVPGMDDYLAALSAQDGFEVRLFNPSTVRDPKLLGYAFDFFRMNRRMHNKSMIADGAFAIIGGRNIGDEYFRVGEDVFYIDMDVIATGAVVTETAAIFDQYWNAPSVFEIERIVDGEGDRAAFEARVQALMATAEAGEVSDKARSSMARLLQGAADLEWTRVQVVADDPAKGQGIATSDQLMITRLTGILGRINERLDLASAYFVPGQKGTAFFTDLSGDGVDVRILTNALDTTDVFLVHSGYSRYRRELLEGGVSLFELKARGESSERDLQVLPFGLSGASLHAKTFAVDKERVFIGSFNFDPRSALLNCEMGFLVQSPAIAEQVTAAFDGPLSTVSYQPQLTQEGKMIWREPISEEKVEIYQEEPGAGWSTRIALAIIGLLPIEWLL